MKAIVLDIDGVLANFVGAFQKKFGVPLKGAEWEISADQWRAIKQDDGFWRDMEPLAGATVLARMSPLPDEYFLLTSRPQYTKNATFDWLVDKGIILRTGHVLHTSRPGKIDELRSLAPAWFLDDSILNAGMADKADYVDARLLLTPYNRSVLQHFPALPTVKSVAAFIELATKGGKHAK